MPAKLMFEKNHLQSKILFCVSLTKQKQKIEIEPKSAEGNNNFS